MRQHLYLGPGCIWAFVISEMGPLNCVAYLNVFRMKFVLGKVCG